MDSLSPMIAQDALWLTTDRPNCLMIIDPVMIIAGNPTYEAVQRVVRTRKRRLAKNRRIQLRDVMIGVTVMKRANRSPGEASAT